MKLFCASAAILASSMAPVAAQIGSWDITYNGTETNFVAGATDDITVTYLISSGRNATATAYATDCSTPIDASVLTTFTTGLTPGSPDDELSVSFICGAVFNVCAPPNLISYPRPPSLYLRYLRVKQIVLDLDKSAITTSNIWDDTDELIEFCVKVELLSEAGSVIKFE